MKRLIDFEFRRHTNLIKSLRKKQPDLSKKVKSSEDQSQEGAASVTEEAENEDLTELIIA